MVYQTCVLKVVNVSAVHVLCGALISTHVGLSHNVHCGFAFIGRLNFLQLLFSGELQTNFKKRQRWRFITHDPKAHHNIKY